MTPTAISIIGLRNLVDDILQEAGCQRFRPATPGRRMRAGYELSCTNARIVSASGAIRLRHFPYHTGASIAAHEYWQALLGSPKRKDLYIVGEITTKQRGELTIWIVARGFCGHRAGVA